MSEYYLSIKLLHIASVIGSGTLFAVRGALMWIDSRWTNHVLLRRLSYAIDTVLLGAAIALVCVLRQFPLESAWVTAKLLLLVVYVLLGIGALRRGKTRRIRQACFIAALVVYAFIISVAISHDPRGWFTLL
jgi:uncharacterized membrane protein SirB2